MVKALSSISLGVGWEYFNKYLSREPAFTPMRIEQLLLFAAPTTSATLSGLPILPGLILKQAAPASAASITRL